MRMDSKHATKPDRRRSLNVSIQSSLIEEAKKLNINLSRGAEEGLRHVVREEKKRRWLEDNKEAVAALNDFVEKNGVLITPIWMRDDVTF